MADYSSLHKRARHDIRVCIQAWSETLRNQLGGRIACMFAKGSAVKRWDSPIDYVPVISDVDIDLILSDEDDRLVTSSDPLTVARALSRQHEETFARLEPAPLHHPRTHMRVINSLMREEWYVPPQPDEIRPVIGSLPELPEPPPERVRYVDRWRLEQEEGYLRDLPDRLASATGTDLLYLILDLAGHVALTPFRLLTQVQADPVAVWRLNRSRVLDELENEGMGIVANHYLAFYERGWDLFLSGLKDHETARDMAIEGYQVLRTCLSELGEL